jgi:hypothetical protein
VEGAKVVMASRSGEAGGCGNEIREGGVAFPVATDVRVGPTS